MGADTEDQVLYQGPGYTIAVAAKAETMTHYNGYARPDGSVNHGFVDLRDRPDLVGEIPETRKSAGLAEILRVANDVGSPFLTIGCECTDLEPELTDQEDLFFQVGGFADVTFRDHANASDKEKLIQLACKTLSGIGAPPAGVMIGFEFIVEPLKFCFGHSDCYGVMFKALGRGRSSEEAWSAFGVAATAIAKSLGQLTDGKF